MNNKPLVEALLKGHHDVDYLLKVEIDRCARLLRTAAARLKIYPIPEDVHSLEGNNELSYQLRRLEEMAIVHILDVSKPGGPILRRTLSPVMSDYYLALENLLYGLSSLAKVKQQSDDRTRGLWIYTVLEYTQDLHYYLSGILDLETETLRETPAWVPVRITAVETLYVAQLASFR